MAGRWLIPDAGGQPHAAAALSAAQETVCLFCLSPVSHPGPRLHKVWDGLSRYQGCEQESRRQPFLYNRKANSNGLKRKVRHEVRCWHGEERGTQAL